MNSCVSVVQDESIMAYSDYNRVKNMVKEALENYLVSVYGTRDIRSLIKPGMKIVIKPNLVHELNFLVRFDHIDMDNPNDCFIDSISVTICECPLQSCTVEKIINQEMLADLERTYNIIINFVDARRTKYIYGKKEPTVLHGLRSEDNYVDIDLGSDSVHSQYDDKVDRFRVTDYPPDEMRKFHSKGRHIYRIAKEIMDADIVISVPKLKTHMKAGITNAMKNFVGIVGNKECLPHHTKGCPSTGGDNYGDFSLIKIFSEYLVDRANNYLLTDEREYYKRRKIVDMLLRIRKVFCLDGDITGSWYGNDTISRTVVDLNRLVYFGGKDGKMHDHSQRKVLSIVDAIVSGQGEGPMRPRPNYTGFIAVSESTAAADAVCAELIGVDSSKIHYLFEDRVVQGKYSLSPQFSAIDVGRKETFDFVKAVDREIMAPPRWNGKIEKHPQKEFTYSAQFWKSVMNYPKTVSCYITKKKS